MPENTPVEMHDKLPLFNTETWMYEDFELAPRSNPSAAPFPKASA